MRSWQVSRFDIPGKRIESRVKPLAKMVLFIEKIPASVAQLVEQRFCKPLVVGSSPATGSAKA
jgi:hypothetical protein